MLLEYSEQAVKDILNAANSRSIVFEVSIDEHAERLFMLYKHKQQSAIPKRDAIDNVIQRFSEIAQLEMSPELLEAVKSELALKKLQGIL